ncbi:MAG: c-type cytochrome biogenesis protein CcsB [Nitrospirae bacterium CG_4_9_14_3_um_filter_53_35]|nr:MAG: c-type cytochrome biogenesis protein CcsB [Nitrospirae bacterium CG08_land_8_20_14_0_20_52_24]PIV82341.1 MAG: c-type cytochrome biogenesis protein CcsB [Nitrospirae bacterium CG17_big_fil_post_rev_8_21_14_2_50_50_9]PIW85406.1 MAG: c-type cytochrome biogenesis protein CcsB [Nitrospirae bacterium CG_4_8_14_3_um_filter_50_41]PIX86071.1 MAG: c-type cytochrome biogenesis protein CcsB [Nitrospirae bacterium CG_4_10_14_3_um_filter_53_41]PJA77278.1 MAG: c-type cytochrome biogenesis protein CcsB
MMIENILVQEAGLLQWELRVFWVVVTLYGISALFYLFHLFAPDRGSGKIGSWILRTAVLLHTGMILLRSYAGGRPPFQSLYESLSWFSWSTVMVYLYMERRWNKVFLPGLIVTLMASGACLFALFTREPEINPLFPALQSNWFVPHVVLAFLSYAVFVVSSSVEIVYVFLRPAVLKGKGKSYGLLPGNLETFHRSAYNLVLFGYPLLTFGIISGAVWADNAWGRFWSWDPKETWSLITWTVFTIYMHAMTIPKWRGWQASLFNILGFICMIMTFIGVSWLAKLFSIESLHIYAL